MEETSHPALDAEAARQVFRILIRPIDDAAGDTKAPMAFGPTCRVIRGHEITDMQASIRNDLAVGKAGHRPSRRAANGRDISGNSLITDVWVLRNAKWLVAERDSSRQEKASVRGAFQAFDRGR
jgi:hypothetical protein